MLAGTAECFVAVPGVVVVAVFAAVCEASVTDGLKTEPATVVVVVGVVIEPPGF